MFLFFLVLTQFDIALQDQGTFSKVYNHYVPGQLRAIPVRRIMSCFGNPICASRLMLLFHRRKIRCKSSFSRRCSEARSGTRHKSRMPASKSANVTAVLVAMARAGRAAAVAECCSVRRGPTFSKFKGRRSSKRK